MTRWGLVMGLLWGLSGCVVNGDASDKPCPCATGFVCMCGERCVPDGTSFECLDAGAVGLCPTEAQVRPTGLRREWSTPHTIALGWDPPADGEDTFLRYEVWIAGTLDELLDERLTSTYDPRTNPELGAYRLPRTMGGDLVDFTILHDLPPSQEGWIALLATDNRGVACARTLGPVSTQPEPAGAAVLFEDTHAGARLPGSTCFELTTVGEHANGSAAHVRYVQRCGRTNDSACDGDALGSCWVNLTLNDLNVSLARLDRGGFSQAYLEFWMRVDLPLSMPSPYSTVSIRLGSSAGPTYDFEGFTLRGGSEYRRYEFPLNRLVNGTEALTHERTRGNVVSVKVGGSFRSGTALHLDEIRIRWP